MLPGMSKIVKLFSDRGYILSDKILQHQCSDEITEICFVLGTSDPNILIETQYSFGVNSPSVYSSTHAGVLQMGRVSQMMTNIPALPRNNAVICISNSHVGVQEDSRSELLVETPALTSSGGVVAVATDCQLAHNISDGVVGEGCSLQQRSGESLSPPHIHTYREDVLRPFSVSEVEVHPPMGETVCNDVHSRN